MPRRGISGAGKADTEADESAEVRDALGLLGQRGVLAILQTLASGAAGFNEIGRRTAMHPAILSRRLALLEREDVLAKRIVSTMPPKGEYSLTQSGVALIPVIEAIRAWALARHSSSPVNKA